MRLEPRPRRAVALVVSLAHDDPPYDGSSRGDPPAAATAGDAGEPTAPSTLDAAAERLTGLQRALTIQDGDSFAMGAVKILGMIATAILLLALSPLILLGLAVGLAAAA